MRKLTLEDLETMRQHYGIAQEEQHPPPSAIQDTVWNLAMSRRIASRGQPTQRFTPQCLVALDKHAKK